MDQINVLVHKLVAESFSLRATNISQNTYFFELDKNFTRGFSAENPY